MLPETIMAWSYTVEVLEIFQLSPPSGSAPTTSTLPLSFLDIPWLGLPPVQSLFYYEFHHPKTYFLDTILPNLKHSLSLTLQHFYPLAGQLIWPQDSTQPQIVYVDGDSIPLIVAECGYDFQHLSGNLSRNAHEFYPLAPTFEHTASSNKLVPLLATQVTLFPNKGICVGVIFNHAAHDGHTFFQFMKTWTGFCTSQGDTSLLTESLPFYDRTVIKDPHGIETINLNDLKIMNITKETYNILKVPIIPVDKLRGAFVMSSSEIKKLKQWILNRHQKDTPLHLSTFVLISSYVWVCLIKARGGTDNVEDQREYFMFSADCRARLDPPLPKTYLGNCIGGIIAKGNTNELIGEQGIAVAAEVIGKAIMNVDAEVQSVMKKGLVSYISLSPERIVSIAGSPKFATYQTDFGLGKLKKAEVSLTDVGGAISLTDYPDEEGAVEIGIVRDAVEMDAFASVFAKSLKDLS